MTDAREQLIERFIGTWNMTRTIHDYLANSTSHFIGSAVFSPQGKELQVTETGTLTMNGFSTQATRGWVWTFPQNKEDAGKVNVHFDDGRLCHEFDASETEPRAYHWCDPDEYHVTYEWLDQARWKTVWRVTGPRKDYKMETLFSRP